MAVATNTPGHYFSSDNTGGGTPSGEAVRQRDARLNSKAGWHQKALDNGFDEGLVMALEFLGFEEDTVSIQWKPIEYITEEEKLALVAQKVELGIPLSVALAEAGYDEDTVLAWTTGQPTDGELEKRVGILATMGDALQKLGTASALGIDMTQINEVIDLVLKDIQGLMAPAPAEGE
jgi:hypothetical protein